MASCRWLSWPAPPQGMTGMGAAGDTGGVGPPAVNVCLPLAWLTLHALGVYRYHDALAAELVGASLHQRRVLDSRRVDRHLVSPSPQHTPHVIYGADFDP